MKDSEIQKAEFIDTMILRAKHWEGVFQNADYQQVLWHQVSPDKSLQLVQKYSDKDAKVVDAGCGASFLVDRLLECGYKDITLLDTAKTSLEIVKERVGCENIEFLSGDILNFTTDEKFDIWHDRAVFHFLTTKKEQEQYFQVVMNSLKSGGIAIISTFRVNGPLQCAGLDIEQYDADKMSKELPEGLELVASQEYMHITPKQSKQEYIYFTLKRK